MKYTIYVVYTNGKPQCIGVFDTKAEAEAWNEEWDTRGIIVEIIP
jgi:hypothetical protein